MNEQIHVEDELRTALDRLSLVLSATGLGVWERDLETNQVKWSETMYRVFGRPPEHFSGSPDEVLSFVHPDDRAEFRRGYQEAVYGAAGSFEQEFRIVRPDGEIRWLQRRGQVRRDAGGRAYSVFGVALDVTERKQAEEANARLAALVAAADDAIIGLSPDGLILAWNPAAERMFGYPAGEAIGQSALMLYPEQARAEFELAYQRVREGEHFRIEGVRVAKDGRLLDAAMTLSPVLDRNGRVAGASAVVRDMTIRKQTEEKLVETLALLLHTNNQRKLALLAGHMGTFELDLERDAVTWSDEIYEQFGIDKSVPIATTGDIDPLIHPDDQEQVRTRRTQAYQEGGTYEDEFRIVQPSGEVRWIYVRAQAFSDSSNPTRIYGVSMDITERKEHEAHIRFLMSEVAHRSKNMLAVVQAIAAQTARTTSSPADFAATFGARLKSLASSLDLVVQQEWRGVSVRELVVSQLGHHVGPNRARMDVIGPDALLSPLAAQYLGMALHELSTNAIKYGALSVPTGKVRIEWSFPTRNGSRRFVISWIESGGPRVSAAGEKGFGSLVVERMVAEALQGHVTLEYEPEGLRWRLEAEASSAIKEPDAATAPREKR